MYLIANARSIAMLGVASLALAACDGPAASTAPELIPPGEIGETECEDAAEALWSTELGSLSPVNLEDLRTKAELCQVILEEDFEDAYPAATTDTGRLLFVRREYGPHFAECYMAGAITDRGAEPNECKAAARAHVEGSLAPPSTAPTLAPGAQRDPPQVSTVPVPDRPGPDVPRP